MARVRVLSTGGTIASTGDDGAGKTPSVSGDDLVEAVPEIGDFARVEVESVCQRSGFQMDVESATAIVDAAERAASDGVDGVVVTHGTDTMAESAYYVDVVSTADVPVVFTGAQRPFDDLGTDGPANLAAAVRAAADDRFRGQGGSYLAFNDHVHAARWVRKRHTSKLETFASPTAGPIAEVSPAGLRLLREPGRYSPRAPGVRIDPAVRVEIVTNALGADGRLVAAIREAGGADAVDAIVLAGTGLGNATGSLGAALEDAVDSGVPVVLTSRCGEGATVGFYGGPGGGKTLVAAGAIPGGDLAPWKARLTAMVALSTPDVDLDALFEGVASVD